MEFVFLCSNAFILLSKRGKQLLCLCFQRKIITVKASAQSTQAVKLQVTFIRANEKSKRGCALLAVPEVKPSASEKPRVQHLS